MSSLNVNNDNIIDKQYDIELATLTKLLLPWLAKDLIEIIYQYYCKATILYLAKNKSDLYKVALYHKSQHEIKVIEQTFLKSVDLTNCEAWQYQDYILTRDSQGKIIKYQISTGLEQELQCLEYQKRCEVDFMFLYCDKLYIVCSGYGICITDPEDDIQEVYHKVYDIMGEGCYKYFCTKRGLYIFSELFREFSFGFLEYETWNFEKLGSNKYYIFDIVRCDEDDSLLIMITMNGFYTFNTLLKECIFYERKCPAFGYEGIKYYFRNDTLYAIYGSNVYSITRPFEEWKTSAQVKCLSDFVTFD